MNTDFSSQPEWSDEQLQAMLDELNASERGVGFNPSRITAVIKSDRFHLKMRGEKQAFEKMEMLEGQIVASLITRQLYAGNLLPYPVCSSLDGGMTGRLAADLPFNPHIENGQECPTCPWNEWGTSVNWVNYTKEEAGATYDGAPSEKGKACGERRALVMLLPNFADPIVVRLSTASIGTWDAYANSFALKGGSYIEWLTRISVENVIKGTMEFGKAIFTPVQKLERQVIIGAIQSRQAVYRPLLQAQSIVEATSPLERDMTPIGEAMDERLDEQEGAEPELPF